MSKENSPSEKHVIFWALLGPFVVLLTLFVSVVKATPEGLYIPLVAVAGIPLCWKWKQRGLLISLLFLGLVVVICYGQLPIQQRFWHVGLGMSVALSFIVSTLAFEEAESRLEHGAVESRSRLENLLRLNEQFTTLQDRYQCEREDYAVQRKLGEQERENLHHQLAAVQETTQIAQQEISNFHKERQRLLEDLFGEQRKTADLKLKAQDLEAQVGELQKVCEHVPETPPAPEPLIVEKECDEEQRRELARVNGLYTQLREQFQEKDKVLHEVRRELFEKEGALHNVERQLEDLKCHDRSRRERELEQQLQALADENTHNREEVDALTELVDSLMMEKKA